MAKATVYNQSGQKVKEVELDPKVFNIEINPELVSQAVITLQANSRPNVANSKDRSEVSGGGKKPWRQKGTGRARHGSIRSPLWKGGGVTFGPTKVRNFSKKLNKKANRKAILMSLTDKALAEKIVLVDKFEFSEAKTKKFFEILTNLKLRDQKVKTTESKKDSKTSKEKKEKSKKSKVKTILLVLPKKDEKVERAAKNISNLEIIRANSLNVLEILKQEYLLLPVDSLEVIQKTFVK